jgi:hypothetical protein
MHSGGVGAGRSNPPGYPIPTPTPIVFANDRLRPLGNTRQFPGWADVFDLRRRSCSVR